MAFLTDLKWINGKWIDFATNDTIYGTAGSDQVVLGAGKDFFNDIDGGHDQVTDVARDSLGSGNDVVSTGIGNDGVTTDLDSANAYYGGLGRDTLNVSPAQSGVFVNLAQGFAQNLGTGVQSVVNSFENVSGSINADTIYGDSWSNNIYGGAGNDLIDGGTSGDVVMGMEGNDRVFGGADYDIVVGGLGDDQVYGDAGGDTVYGNEGNDRVSGGTGHDTLYGGDGNDLMFGEADMDYMLGEAGNDIMHGGTGEDTLLGGLGNDALEGMAGRDFLSGNAGNDRFVFRSLADSPLATPDRITDFQHIVDKMDVSLIDARANVAGNQAFSYIGDHGFTNSGQIKSHYFAAQNTTVVSLNTDTDSAAEMTINLTGHITLAASDFIL
ncbi:MAG: calcium-binding protein [Hyphomicrobium sp.]